MRRQGTSDNGAITRRDALRAIAAVAAGAALPSAAAAPSAPTRLPAASSTGKVPLVHITDLYQPPQDPDDHFDLATIAALPEFDLRAVILDATEKFLVAKPAGWDIARDPGYVPVAQLSYLTGKPIPVAIGPTQPLTDTGDAAVARPAVEQAGIALLLDVLDQSPEPVTISVVGSARVLAAAFNRRPDLVRAKTRVVVLNAGSTGGPKREWNVGLDPAAYVALWRSGLPIDWFPCATEHGAFDPADARGTFWRASQRTLLRALPEGLRGWFGYALSGSSRGDIIRALSDAGHGAEFERLLDGERNFWATASLVMTAGRVLARTPAGWRFVPAAGAADVEQWPLHLDPIVATVDDNGAVAWRLSDAPARARLFGRRPGAAYGAAMAEALNALLCAMPA